MNSSQINKVAIALGSVLALVAIYFVISSNPLAEKLPPVEKYITSIESEEIPGDTMLAIVTPVDVPNELYSKGFFSYDLIVEPPMYRLDHAFAGIACGNIQYETKLQDDTLVIYESLEGECKETQNYHVGGLLTDSREFNKIELRLLLNGALLNVIEYEIDKSIPQFPVQE